MTQHQHTTAQEAAWPAGTAPTTMPTTHKVRDRRAVRADTASSSNSSSSMVVRAGMARVERAGDTGRAGMGVGTIDE